MAISAAIVYKSEWPLLIVCPQTLQSLWREEFVKWIPKFDVGKIQIVRGAPDEQLCPQAAIYIVSYQSLVQKPCLDLIKTLPFKVCIADCASVLKKKGSDWEEPLIQFFSAMKRIMLLTGTRLTSNPIEIHNLVKIVRPDSVPDFLKFSNRFCDPVTLKGGVQFMGPSFSQELELLFRKRFASSWIRAHPNAATSTPATSSAMS